MRALAPAAAFVLVLVGCALGGSSSVPVGMRAQNAFPVRPFATPSPFDSARIYVADYHNQRILTFTTEGVPTAPTINLSYPPSGIAVSPSGKLYIATNRWGKSLGAIFTYYPDGAQTSPSMTEGLSDPNGMAFDKAGNLYVANFDDYDVLKFNPHGRLMNPVFKNDISLPEGVAVDGAGRVYVANLGHNNITTYLPDGTQTLPTLTGGLYTLRGIALDRTGTLYAAAGDTIVQFAPDGTRLPFTITRGLNNPYELTFGPAGQLYACNVDHISTYMGLTEIPPTIYGGIGDCLGVAVYKPPSH